MGYIELGSRVKDIVTGMTGIATSRKQDMNGCEQYCISGKIDKDGKMQDSYWIDHAQLEIVDDGVKGKIEQKDTGSSTTKATSNKV